MTGGRIIMDLATIMLLLSYMYVYIFSMAIYYCVGSTRNVCKYSLYSNLSTVQMWRVREQKLCIISNIPLALL